MQFAKWCGIEFPLSPLSFSLGVNSVAVARSRRALQVHLKDGSVLTAELASGSELIEVHSSYSGGSGEAVVALKVLEGGAYKERLLLVSERGVEATATAPHDLVLAASADFSRVMALCSNGRVRAFRVDWGRGELDLDADECESGDAVTASWWTSVPVEGRLGALYAFGDSPYLGINSAVLAEDRALVSPIYRGMSEHCSFALVKFPERVESGCTPEALYVVTRDPQSDDELLYVERVRLAVSDGALTFAEYDDELAVLDVCNEGVLYVTPLPSPIGFELGHTDFVVSVSLPSLLGTGSGEAMVCIGTGPPSGRTLTCSSPNSFLLSLPRDVP